MALLLFAPVVQAQHLSHRRHFRIDGSKVGSANCGQNFGGWSEQWSTDGSTLSQCAAGAAGGWAPSGGADLKHWYRIDSVVTDGDGITTATDKAGSDDITQATGSKKPGVLVANLNGHDVASHDGINDELAGAFSALLSQPTTIFFVFKLRTDPTIAKTLWDGDDATNRQFGGYVDSIKKFYIWSGTRLSGPTEDTSWHYLVGIYDGASSKLRVDATEFTGGAGTNAIDGLTIGAAHTSTLYGDIDWADWGIYSKAADAALISNLETYMKDRYGL